MVARGEGLGKWVKRGKGLRSIDWQLQNSHGDVEYSMENREQHCNNYVWCQVGAGNIEGSTL